MRRSSNSPPPLRDNRAIPRAVDLRIPTYVVFTEQEPRDDYVVPPCHTGFRAGFQLNGSGGLCKYLAINYLEVLGFAPR